MVNKYYTLTNISIYVLIILLCLLLLSTSDIKQIKNIIPFLNFYQKNQSSKLINSIISINIEEDCPKNSFPFIFYIFQGTTKGCLISNNDLEKDSCSLWDKIFKKTKEIKETKSKNFNNIFSKKLCFTSLNGNNYLSNLKNTNIEENKKYCGILDTTGKKYYIDNEKECPINKIIINNQKNINDDKYTFNSIELIQDKYYLHYSNDFIENNNFLITNESFLISEGLPCIKPDEINTYHIQYILSRANESFICDTNIENKRLDIRYIPIINIRKNELHKYNNINLEDYLYYPFQDVELTLYQIGYIGTDTNFNSEIFPRINEIISDINKISDLNKSNEIIKRIIYSFIFIIIVNLILKYFISDITIYVLNYILLIIIIVNLVIITNIHILIDDLGKFDKYYLNQDNDAIFNLQMKYINKIINDSNERNTKNIWGNVLIFIFICIFNYANHFIFNNPKKSILKYKNENNSSRNNKYYNSINVLKPASYDIKKSNLVKFKEEIELPKINNDKEDKDIFDNDKDEEENNLTTENIINND